MEHHISIHDTITLLSTLAIFWAFMLFQKVVTLFIRKLLKQLLSLYLKLILENRFHLISHQVPGEFEKSFMENAGFNYFGGITAFLFS